MLSPGTRIADRYEVVGTLGSGGMGHVYRARRVKLGDEVAIKVMQTDEDASPEMRERFLRESRAGALLKHPNIVGGHPCRGLENLTPQNAYQMSQVFSPRRRLGQETLPWRGGATCSSV